MKTATVSPVQAAARPPNPYPSTADIDTRIVLAGVFMDVVLDQPAVREARQEAADAIATAAGYAVAGVVSAGRQVAVQPHPVLRRAGDIIRTRGWARHVFTDREGAVCALQAVRLAAAGNGPALVDAVTVLLDRIAGEFADGVSSVSGWNDQPGRTQADILRLLR